MNFTEFVESLQEPLYEVKDKEPKCPPGFIWDKDAKACVPDAKTRKGNPGDPPPPMAEFGIWGATGLNGDGYALAEK
jgi:hypothetical protein